MKKILNYLFRSISVLVLITSVASCKKDKVDPETDPFDEAYAGSEVYIAGTLENNKAILWKNGVPTYLEHGERGGEATGVLAAGQDILVAGMTREDHRRATYWKNGQKAIVDAVRDADVRKMHRASNGDLYFMGNDFGAGDTWSTIWKNNNIYPLQYPGGRYDLSGMLTIGNDFYTYGTTLIKSWNATIWKNGKVLKQFPAESTLDFLAVNGQDFYYYLYNNTDPKTGKRTFKVYRNDALFYSIDLTDDEWSNSPRRYAFQIGGDSYVAFDVAHVRGETKEVRVWKNGKRLPINIKGIFTITALYVKGSDVYTATLREDETFSLKPELYKNNQLLPVDYDGKTLARFNSIFVK